MVSTSSEVVEYNSMYLILPAATYFRGCSPSNINECQKIFQKILLGGKMLLVSYLATNYKSVIHTMWES
jgi:hypothetical protein